MFGRKRGKKKAAKQAQLEHEAENQQQDAAEQKSLEPIGNGQSAADGSIARPPSPAHDPEAARKMRGPLQKALKRPVILPNERRVDQVKRTVLQHRALSWGWPPSVQA